MYLVWTDTDVIGKAASCRISRLTEQGKEAGNTTSELQTPQLKSDKAVADLDKVDQGVEVVRS